MEHISCQLRNLATLIEEFELYEQKKLTKMDIGLLNGKYREVAIQLLQEGFNISKDTATALVEAAYFAGA